MQKEIRTRKIQKRKQLYLDLLGGVCIECYTTDGLRFDHVMPEDKIFNISQYYEVAIEKVLPELQKCQLLCDACHNKKTISDRTGRLGIEIPHGTSNAYKNRGCRCDKCKSAFSKYQKSYRNYCVLKKPML